MAKEGKIIIISAPSGCGKSTIINALMKRGNIRLQFSVSATNRPPRTGEVDGVNYHFLTDEEFRAAIERNEFVEWEEVYPGRFYGTLRTEVEQRCDAGENVVLDIDVKGGVNVKNMFGNKAISIFIMPPDIEELRRRLEARATDPQDAIDRRVAKAGFEISYAPQYDATVVNDNLAKAVEETEKLILDFVG